MQIKFCCCDSTEGGRWLKITHDACFREFSIIEQNLVLEWWDVIFDLSMGFSTSTFGVINLK